MLCHCVMTQCDEVGLCVVTMAETGCDIVVETVLLLSKHD